MPSPADVLLALGEIAERIRRAWLAGDICSLVGRGCRARVLRLKRLVAAGEVSLSYAVGVARLSEHVAMGVLPLPERT